MALRIGVRLVGHGKGILVPKASICEIRHAGISGKAMRVEELEKPKPWPYIEKGFTNLHAFLDGTLKRLEENSKVILVEGLPGVGKTEVAKNLAAELEMKHFPMVTMDSYYINPYGYDMRKLDPKLPLKYQSYDVNNFIKNPSDDRAPSMQFTMFYLKFFQYVDALAHVLNTGDGVVLERSVYSDIAFLETMFSFNYVNRREQRAYYEWRDLAFEKLMKPHLVIYLDASPETVEENLKRRGKGEEKVFNRAFLEKLNENYKNHFLKTITDHAELLVYDWNTPGEPEIIVEDIERIDFNSFDKLDSKMGDWRMSLDLDWSQKRWLYTNTVQRERLRYMLVNHYCYDCERLYIPGEDNKLFFDVWDSAPGMEYSPGYNPDQGDNVLLKVKGSGLFGFTHRHPTSQ